MARIAESVVQERALTVKDGVTEGVKLIGNKSANGRLYPDPVIAEAVNRGAYNGAKVYLNHPGKSLDNRDFNDWVGVVENSFARTGGGYGNVRWRQEHPRYKEIVEAIEKFPKQFGFSHVADIDSDVKGKTEHVNRIGEVFSVDVVTDPATTRGVFESKSGRKTVQEILDATKDSESKLRPILEAMAAHLPGMPSMGVDVPDMGMGGGYGDPMGQPQQSQADQQIQEALKAKVLEQLAAGDAGMWKKVLAAIGLGDSISGLASGEGGGASDQNTDGEDAADNSEESDMSDSADKGADAGKDKKAPPDFKKEAAELRQKLAVQESKNLLLAAGREASEIQVEAVAAIADEAKRKLLVESFPKAKGATAESRNGRPEKSPPAHESKDGDEDEAPRLAQEGSRWQRRVKAAQESKQHAAAARR